MNFLTITATFIFIIWVYALFLRPRLLAAYPAIETMETKLWDASRQVLMARVLSLGGVIVALHDYVLQSGVDTSSLLQEIAKFVPEKYQPLALAGAMMLAGIALEWLRKVTTGPVGSSLPSNKED